MASRAGLWLVSGALAAAAVTSCGSPGHRSTSGAPTGIGSPTTRSIGSPTASSIGTPAAGSSGTGSSVAPGSGHSAVPVRPGHRWMPTPGEAWQWQLTTPVDTSVNVPVYDIDLFENSAAVVSRLHALGRHVICYVSVGSAESFRPDYASFPASVLGKSNGWPGERWLDIRQLPVLEAIMATRLDQCQAKGFDAVEPDNVDGYTNATGFPLTAADQLAYNRMIARLAHERGLSVGLKNDVEQVGQLVGDFDFTVNEECYAYDECSSLLPFIRAGKAVFHVEYSEATSAFCPQSRAYRFSSMKKNLDLDAARWPC